LKFSLLVAVVELLVSLLAVCPQLMVAAVVVVEYCEEQSLLLLVLLTR
jgi:hypothetical protein